MKVCLAQINVEVGNFESNTHQIIQNIQNALSFGAEVVVFPELALTGYPPRDFLEYADFMKRVSASIEQIAAICVDCCVILGAPSINPELKGKNLHNSAYVLFDGRVQQIIHKTLLPTYDVFDEYRYFEPNTVFQTVQYHEHRLAVVICEDTWDIGQDPLYTVCPLDQLMPHQPSCIINLSASPFSYSQMEKRIEMMKWNTQKYHVPMLYVNHVGSQTELIFDGGSMCMDADGNLCAQLPCFEEGLLHINTSNLQPIQFKTTSPIHSIYDALILGIRDYFAKLGFQKAILGLSGGIDSAVTCALAVDALGSENVYGVLMPSPYSSDHSIEDAKQLAITLGIHYDIIPIHNLYSAFCNHLEPYFEGKSADVTEENIQARIRAVLLMALSNKKGYILLNTSNKSESAVGYGTLYGDMCGGLSVLGDLYKTQVYDLAHFINQSAVRIPLNSIHKPPSAELRDNQKDEDTLPPYDVLDPLLIAYIENHQGPDSLIDAGFEPDLVHRVLKMVNTNEYKRYQTPPILRISDKAFGMGRRMPIVAKYLS